MLQLKTYQVPESYGFTLWNILSYMYSVKLKFPFCRCGLLFGSQQSSEERNSLCIHAARIFNELLQDWNGPSQWLLHEGTAFPASLWKHKRVLLKKKQKTCLFKQIWGKSLLESIKNLYCTSCGYRQPHFKLYFICVKYTHVDAERGGSVIGEQPVLLQFSHSSHSYPRSAFNDEYREFSCWVPASQAPKHWSCVAV